MVLLSGTLLNLKPSLVQTRRMPSFSGRISATTRSSFSSRPISSRRAQQLGAQPRALVLVVDQERKFAVVRALQLGQLAHADNLDVPLLVLHLGHQRHFTVVVDESRGLPAARARRVGSAKWDGSSAGRCCRARCVRLKDAIIGSSSGRIGRIVTSSPVWILKGPRQVRRVGADRRLRQVLFLDARGHAGRHGRPGR